MIPPTKECDRTYLLLDPLLVGLLPVLPINSAPVLETEPAVVIRERWQKETNVKNNANA